MSASKFKDTSLFWTFLFVHSLSNWLVVGPRFYHILIVWALKIKTTDGDKGFH